MKLSDNYLDTFETAKEVTDAILSRKTVIRNSEHSNNHKYAVEAVKKSLGAEIEQLKLLLKHKFNQEFIDDEKEN
jgi:hypothetical protein